MKSKAEILLCAGLFFALSAASCGQANGEAESKSGAEGRDEIVITIVGDVMLSRGVQQYLENYGYEYPYEEVRDLFLEDDLTIANLECPITSCGNPANKVKRFVFRADLENAAALRDAGFDCMNLANNHSMDYLSKGLGQTMELLWEAGVATVGAGMNAEADASYVFEKDGYRVGVLAFSAFPTEGFFYDAKEPTVSYVSDYNMDQVAQKIAALECDYKIVYFHWGIEYRPYISETQEAYAHMAVESGADFVVGTHPHVVQESEIYEEKPIYYSLGNFVFDTQIPAGTDETLILQLTLDEDGLKRIEEIPAKIVRAQVVLAEGEND